ncbi:glycosyltransferase family 2 protein [Anaerophaga thermohalophila]|uniref:glycosyltransferase family 2 protein n=1 Tax=Anaerophaga thermohalophila TaxID=177400 RepID=UPI0003135FE3|nr:glycosyltransferase family 2 protein [Anaerophaga thermohalophila]
MQNIPFFSVVIPIYNKGPHIHRSISSVLNQTFRHFELLLVNDASTDKSLEEIQKFNDRRIRIFHRTCPGPGGYAGRNLGIRKANGRWIAFLDADDEWIPDHLKNMFELIQEFPDESVIGSGWKESWGEETSNECSFDPYYLKYSNRGNHRLSFEDYLRAECSYLRPIWTSIACIRRELLIVAGGFPENLMKRGGDVDTWLRCIEQAGGLGWSAHVGAIYYRDSVNMVTKTSWSDAIEQQETIKKILPKYSGKLATLLKKYSNRRVLSAWRLNFNTSNKKNFRLYNNLYIWVDLKLSMIYVPLSILPPFCYSFLKKLFQMVSFDCHKRLLK